MGNKQFKLFKKEDNDTSDIRHYIEYLNQEKKRNFEQSMPERRKSPPHFAKKTMCDPSNCSNFFTFTKKPVNWKETFIEECKYLSKSFEWGKILPKELSTFESYSEDLHRMEINWIAGHSLNTPFEPDVKKNEQQLIDYREIIDEKNTKSRNVAKNLKSESKISIGQINIPATPKESFIISKKYEEDYNFFDSSLDIKGGEDPFLIEDSNILKNPDEKNDDVSLNNISHSSDLYFIQYPKKVLNYQNNTFLLPKLNEDLSFEEQNQIKNESFVERKKLLDRISTPNESKEKEKYKLMTKTIEKHLNTPLNPLSFIKTKYIEYFIEKYQDNVYKQYDPQSREMKNLEMICDNMMKDLRQFIRVFKDAIYYFYQIKTLVIKYKSLGEYFTLDNMINFVLCLIFTEEVYTIVFEIQRKVDHNKEINFKKNLKKLKDKRPEDFGIPDKFCLNQRTNAYFKSNSKTRIISPRHDDKIENENPEEFKEISTDKVEAICNEPYSKAIDCIKNIQFLKSPTHKLKAILASSEMIMESISDFYSKINVKFNKDIDPDDIMTIYIYMISKSALTTLITHCNLIEKFLTESSLASISGYYFITLNASIDYINNFKEENCNNLKKNVNVVEKPRDEKKFSQATNSASSNINEQRMNSDSAGEEKKKEN